GLLSERSEMQALSRDLASAGVDVSAVENPCGEQGARILDAPGPYHRRRARIARAFQRLRQGADALAVSHRARGHGELVLHVPAPPADRRRIAALLQRHQVHDVGYFGPGTFEQFPIPDAG